MIVESRHNTVGTFKKWLWDEDRIKIVTDTNQRDQIRIKFCKNSYDDHYLDDNEHTFAVMYKRELEN